jgi:hypothetical protein
VLSVVYAGQAPLAAEAKTKPSGTSEVEVFAKAVDEGKDLGAYIIAITTSGNTTVVEDVLAIVWNLLAHGKPAKEPNL